MFPVFEKNIHVVQADETLTAYDVLVFLTLLDYVDHKTRIGRPSQSTIANDAHCSLRTVTSAVKRLSERGHIQIVNGDETNPNTQRPNTYFIPELTKRESDHI